MREGRERNLLRKFKTPQTADSHKDIGASHFVLSRQTDAAKAAPVLQEVRNVTTWRRYRGDQDNKLNRCSIKAAKCAFISEGRKDI